MKELKKAKAQCLADLTAHFGDYAHRLNAIDPRLVEYIEDALSNGASHANLYELLGIRKVFRLMDSYDIDAKRVQMVIRAIEGQWRDGKHIKGGLKFDTPRGNRHVRQMPYQVWCLFGIYGFVVEVDMERDYHDGDELLPSEFVRNGRVWDKRRLTTEADLFQTRKSGKTEEGAAIDFVEVCFLGPANGQALICANSHEQAKIAYKAIKEFAAQVDPTCLNRMGGKYFRLTATEMNWQPGYRMKGEIKTLASGSKISKDGLFASIVHADEHGSARYVAGRSDMQELVNVCAGSMGPRRESLILHTTTAGLVNEGPYKNQIETVEMLLLEELNYPLSEPRRTAEDYRFSFLLRLDPWEISYDIDQLDDPELFRKVNRSIGITVQPTWYKKRLHEARKDEDVRKEVLTKDFNIWQIGTVQEWITPDEIRPLQTRRKIEQCQGREGWVILCGMDFSKGDDLHSSVYLAARSNQIGGIDFFADLDCWITEKALQESSIRTLYEKWIAEGWLHVCPGAVLQPSLPIDRIIHLIEHEDVQFLRWGYDSYQSKDPINTLKAYLWGAKGVNPDQYVVPISQTYASYNPAVLKIEGVVYSDPPLIEFSGNPLWPWCFGNCVLDEDHRMSNRKMIKRNPGSDACKVDPVQCLATCFILFNQVEGNFLKI